MNYKDVEIKLAKENILRSCGNQSLKLYLIKRKPNAISLLVWTSQPTDITFAAASLLGVSVNRRNPNYVTINYGKTFASYQSLVEQLNTLLGYAIFTGYEIL